VRARSTRTNRDKPSGCDYTEASQVDASQANAATSTRTNRDEPSGRGLHTPRQVRSVWTKSRQPNSKRTKPTPTRSRQNTSRRTRFQANHFRAITLHDQRVQVVERRLAGHVQDIRVGETHLPTGHTVQATQLDASQVGVGAVTTTWWIPGRPMMSRYRSPRRQANTRGVSPAAGARSAAEPGPLPPAPKIQRTARILGRKGCLSWLWTAGGPGDKSGLDDLGRSGLSVLVRRLECGGRRPGLKPKTPS
jgi:hypothetical protein